jgi:hypothetical protein
MNKRYAAGAILLAAVATAAGLFASPSKSAPPSPSTLKQASDTISVSVIGDAGYLGFGGTASPFTQISFFDGNNWHFTAINSLSGSSCNLTNGGATCSFANPSMSAVNGRFAVGTHFTGTPPTTVAGQVVYADASTETFTAAVTYPPPPFPAEIRNALLTGMKDGKPGLEFKLQGNSNIPTLKSFDLRLPRGLRFNRKKVMKGSACHGPGKWQSTPISRKEIRCTPRAPYHWAKAVTSIRISAIHEDSFLEQEVKEHRLKMLPFYITANPCCTLRGGRNNQELIGPPTTRTIRPVGLCRRIQTLTSICAHGRTGRNAFTAGAAKRQTRGVTFAWASVLSSDRCLSAGSPRPAELRGRPPVPGVDFAQEPPVPAVPAPPGGAARAGRG